MTIKLESLHHHQLIGSYIDNTNHDQLDCNLSVDCTMAIGASMTTLEEPSYPPLGSWTVLKGKAPVISQPPSDSVCKYYLDFLLNLKSDLKINHIFCHSDQDVL